MRALIILASLLLCACSSQPPVPESRPESTPRNMSSAWECDPKRAGLWSCSPAEKPEATAAPAPPPAKAPETVVKTGPMASPEAAGDAGVNTTVEQSAASGESAFPTSSSATTAIDEAGAYVLQVGAFRTRESALVAVEEIGLEELRIIPTRRGMEDWFVLVLGAYGSRVDAREAGQAYLHDNPRGSIWVRSAADLKASLVNP